MATRARPTLRCLCEDLGRRCRRPTPAEQVSRLVIAREEVTWVLEGPAADEPPAGQGGRVAGAPRPASPIGAVTVPPWREGMEAPVLPQSYRDLLDVAADAARPLRAGEFATAAGLAPGKAKVEGLRSKLKLPAGRGWLAAVPGGLFTLNDHAGKQENPDSKGALLPRFEGANRIRT
jgi:hypothetical protein